MDKKIMKKLSIFLIILVAMVFGANNVSASLADDILSGNNLQGNGTADVGADVAVPSSVNDAEELDAPSKVDANGNLTIKTGEVYKTAVSISGTLTVNSGADVQRGITAGNVKLGEDVNVEGNITVSGNLNMGSNVSVKGNVKVGGSTVSTGNTTIEGSVNTGTLSIASNFDITGPVFVTSESSTIVIGDNSDVPGTITSKSGLKIGNNSDVGLFLSGDSVEVDGKMYKLGGKIISKGANTDVGLPPLPPKPKSATSTVNVVSNTSVAPTSEDNTDYTSNTSNKIGASVNVNDMVNKITAGVATSTGATANKFNNAVGQAANLTQKALDIANKSIDFSKITTVEDVNKYVADVTNIDQNISSTSLSSDGVNVNYNVPASLFGFIPTSLSADVSVSADKNVDVNFPWYSFLFSTPASESDIASNISSSVDALSTSSMDTLSNKMQVSILNSVLSAFGGLFGN